jgi:hypothetical protein
MGATPNATWVKLPNWLGHAMGVRAADYGGLYLARKIGDRKGIYWHSA